VEKAKVVGSVECRRARFGAAGSLDSAQMAPRMGVIRTPLAKNPLLDMRSEG